MAMPSAPPPFVRLGPDTPVTPLVIAVPHAGRYYPPAIERERAVARAVLEDLEDRYADRLIGDAVADGAVAFVATHARAWIDLNRGEEDMGDPASADTSARARAGLGLVPSRIAGRPLWRRPPGADRTRDRMRTIHAPYHLAIERALAAARAAHGAAILIDCHSMPSLNRPGRPGPRIVIGDRHGATAAPAIVAAVSAAAEARGYSVARNAPYAGAFGLARHGRPERSIHALQIEFDRDLYLTPGLREPDGRLSAITRLFTDLCRAAIDVLPDVGIPLAAE